MHIYVCVFMYIFLLNKVEKSREHKDRKGAYFHPGSKERYPGGEDA